MAAANNYLYSVVGPPGPKEGELRKERESLVEDHFKAGEITTIVASGADLDDVRSLEKLGYSRTDIATYLGSGASPSQLQQLEQEGYNWKEIDKIVKATKNSGAKQQASAGSGGNAPDTISIEIKFVIVTNGNVTPTWKLLRVSANTGSAPLFSLGRTRTHDLITTIGPPGQATANTHLASQIGNAVSNANRAEPITPSSTTFNPFPFPF